MPRFSSIFLFLYFAYFLALSFNPIMDQDTQISNKKQKPKKIPQRGLGVAQLERIRLEEQHHITTPPSLLLPMSSSSSSCSSSTTSSSNTTACTVPLTNSNPLRWSSSSTSSTTATTRQHSSGFVFGSSSVPNLAYELPLPDLMQRAHRYQHPSSMVNVLSTTPFNISPIEPPSNQSYMSMWPEDDKMVGMKRACPFSVDDPSLQCKFPLLSRSDDSTSCTSGFNSDSYYYPIYRECPNSKRSIKENGGGGLGFLSLSPPTTTTIPICPTSKYRPSLSFNQSEFTYFHQGRVEDPDFQSRLGQQQQPYYSFFPQGNHNQVMRRTTMQNSEFGHHDHQSVDLDLKL